MVVVLGPEFPSKCTWYSTKWHCVNVDWWLLFLCVCKFPYKYFEFEFLHDCLCKTILRFITKLPCHILWLFTARIRFKLDCKYTTRHNRNVWFCVHIYILSVIENILECNLVSDRSSPLKIGHTEMIYGAIFDKENCDGLELEIF